jgi:2-polyprenyl-6-hydroxyphenyl methylase / 3-demethylubiquinone-9 3-methyltransferase
VDKPLSFLQDCTKRLKPKGSFFLSTINRTPKSFAIAIVGAEYISGLVPRGKCFEQLTNDCSSLNTTTNTPGTHDWRKFITPDELDTLVKASSPGIELMSTRGMVLDSSIKHVIRNPIAAVMRPMKYMRWTLSERDFDVNYIAHFMKI